MLRRYLLSAFLMLGIHNNNIEDVARAVKEISIPVCKAKTFSDYLCKEMAGFNFIIDAMYYLYQHDRDSFIWPPYPENQDATYAPLNKGIDINHVDASGNTPLSILLHALSVPNNGNLEWAAKHAIRLIDKGAKLALASGEMTKLMWRLIQVTEKKAYQYNIETLLYGHLVTNMPDAINFLTHTITQQNHHGVALLLSTHFSIKTQEVESLLSDGINKVSGDVCRLDEALKADISAAVKKEINAELQQKQAYLAALRFTAGMLNAWWSHDISSSLTSSGPEVSAIASSSSSSSSFFSPPSKASSRQVQPDPRVIEWIENYQKHYKPVNVARVSATDLDSVSPNKPVDVAHASAASSDNRPPISSASPPRGSSSLYPPISSSSGGDSSTAAASSNLPDSPLSRAPSPQ